MLTLKRRVGERILITTPQGEVIVIELGMIDRNQAAIRIGADRSIVIEREEVRRAQVDKSGDRDAQGASGAKGV